MKLNRIEVGPNEMFFEAWFSFLPGQQPAESPAPGVLTAMERVGFFPVAAIAGGQAASPWVFRTGPSVTDSAEILSQLRYALEPQQLSAWVEVAQVTSVHSFELRPTPETPRAAQLSNSRRIPVATLPAQPAVPAVFPSPAASPVSAAPTLRQMDADLRSAGERVVPATPFAAVEPFVPAAPYVPAAHSAPAAASVPAAATQFAQPKPYAPADLTESAQLRRATPELPPNFNLTEISAKRRAELAAEKLASLHPKPLI